MIQNIKIKCCSPDCEFQIGRSIHKISCKHPFFIKKFDVASVLAMDPESDFPVDCPLTKEPLQLNYYAEIEAESPEEKYGLNHWCDSMILALDEYDLNDNCKCNHFNDSDNISYKNIYDISIVDFKSIRIWHNMDVVLYSLNGTYKILKNRYGIDNAVISTRESTEFTAIYQTLCKCNVLRLN